jgi:hypothetical protein
MTKLPITRDNLNDSIMFDSPFTVEDDGIVLNGRTGPHEGIYAPEIYWADGALEFHDDDWSLVDGFSGQYGYSGPIMHVSEYLGGGMADYVLETPGIYVVVVVDDILDDESDEPVGWALLYREI